MTDATSILETAHLIERAAMELDAQEEASNAFDDDGRRALQERASALLDQIAALEGVEQAGPVWEAVRAYREATGRARMHAAKDFDQVRRAERPQGIEDHLALTCMIVRGASPTQIIEQMQMIQGRWDAGDAMRRSQAEVGRAWFGEGE